jgi:hypothetical protein
VIDRPENGPLAIDEDALLSGTVTGSVVGKILASEFDGEAIVFTLTDDAEQRFAISADGVITVADAARLNHEIAPSHAVTVLVTDAAGSTDVQTFTITIRDVNEETRFRPRTAGTSPKTAPLEPLSAPWKRPIPTIPAPRSPSSAMPSGLRTACIKSARTGATASMR